MTPAQRAGWLTAIFCCMIGPHAAAQITEPTPELPTLGAPPADAGATALPAKPIRLEFNVPPAALDPLKLQLGPGPSPSRSIIPPAESNLSRSELKRLNKEEIVTSVTDRFTSYVLTGNERTVVLDFPTTLAQGRMFGRVILFIERDGTSKTRVMTVSEVQKWLIKNNKTIDTLTIGNNIRAGELARFFNTARFQGEPLTTDEQGLYNWLLQMQLLREEALGVAVVEPEVILISVPQVSTIQRCPACNVSAAQRMIVVEHELSHARFATDVPYQNYVLWFWSQAMNVVARGKFTQFFRKRGYDTSIRELLANEMQAFLMHTPDPAVFGAADVGMTDAELNDLRRQFQAGLSSKLPAGSGTPYRLE